MKICIVGLGYIGLPTAAVFSQAGIEVVGVDKKKDIIDTLNRGDIHIEEPGLQDVIKSSVEKSLFRASLKPEKADVYIIAVPTPNLDDEYLSCDLSYVKSACEEILPFIEKGNVVIIESTIAPKSTDDYIKPIFEQENYVIGKDIFLAHCPERVLPGQILHELVYNNRIVGGITNKCTDMASTVYEKVVKGEIIKTEAKTAELSKCMENTFRDVNIALANELAKICETIDVNCLDVIEMANKHPRVNIHQPGPGVGGHCLAIDPYFIYAKAPELAKIIKLSRDTNRSMPYYVVDKVNDLLKSEKKSKIAVFGAAYKGNVDDLRESPSIEIIKLLDNQGYKIDVFDPHIQNNKFVDAEIAVKNADLILVLTDHEEYKYLNYDELAKLMNKPVLFDTKNIINKEYNSIMTIINYGNIYRYIN
ncbi:MAG: nucleotide sugar dehydrogenase [Peptostreptococcaceae bacterium]